MRRANPEEIWWIVECELGRTAMPSRLLAYQGAEVIRGMRYQVTGVRPAWAHDAGDQAAIKESLAEINSARMDDAIRQGVINPGNWSSNHGQGPKKIATPY